MFDYLAIDVGSTYTKLRLIDGATAVAAAEVPTDLEDVGRGIRRGLEALGAQAGAAPEAAQTLASSSAAGGLRMVAMGYMARVTAKAAMEVAMNSGAKILEVISSEDPLDFRVQILKEIRPDVVLLAGGTDFGDEDSLLENAQAIVQSGAGAMVVLAGNEAAQPRAADILRQGGVRFVRTQNILPTIHDLCVDKARALIHREFIRQIVKAKGLQTLTDMLTDDRVVPTPGAVLLGAELLAKGDGLREGLGPLLVVDLGGATTDVHSVVPAYEGLPKEEVGLIVASARQVSYRTVEGNLGMRVSAGGILMAAGARQLLRRAGPGDAAMEERLHAYCARVEAETASLPENEEERLFDRLLAQAAVEIALKRHAGHFTDRADPVMGTIPGTPTGRDLRGIGTVVLVGGFFAHSGPAEGGHIIESAFSRRGISLLPERAGRILVDRGYVLYAAGLLAQKAPEYAFSLLEKSLS
ncbi:MAG: glutamate mutase L [Clostridiales Family XIII bacterium]|jgi:uncharacterized protein (TIGR01319 family)|nr:glutamate mutase L [Clostridiales Family XIII bacterium]